MKQIEKRIQFIESKLQPVCTMTLYDLYRDPEVLADQYRFLYGSTKEWDQLVIDCRQELQDKGML